MNVVELKSTINKLKISEEEQNSRSEPAKESLDKRDQQRLHNLKSRGKKE